MNTCEQAETFRLLLAIGAAPKAEIIAWADDIIARESHPPAWLIDISLAANDDDQSLEAKLREVPCEGDRMVAAYAAVNRALGAFAAGQVSPAQAALMLHRWAFHARVNEDDYTQANVPLWTADEI